MYTIGFTTKFYTLWDVTVEHFTNAYGRKGERVTANYIKNISMDEQAARAKYPDAPVDLGLRGHSSFCRTKWEPLPSDVFPCGMYMGKPIADCTDFGYLYWSVDTNMLCGESRDIAVAEGLIVGLGTYEGIEEADMTGRIVCPGFLDAHIHLESSLVSPVEFARAVIPHGTTTVITDPHEITNVMGTDGIDYMLAATEGLPVDVRFMIPSCVPASPLDESGANLDYRDIDSFFDHPRVQGLAEMMNFPGIIAADSEPVSKIVASQAL